MAAERGGAPRARRVITPEKILALGFLALIVIGGALLSLPVSAAGGRSLGVRRGLFTATSAVCVTGLTVVDVGLELSGFGQAVLICLIQIGGLGFMAFATLAMVALGRRISLRSRLLIRESMNQSSLTGMVRLSLWFLLMALSLEIIGACLLMTRLVPIYGTKGVWYSFFTAISAFCNAGFDLFGGYRSLIDFQSEPVVMCTLMGLIILGGLGFSVMLECVHERFRLKKLSLHAKIVLLSTLVLLIGGAALFLLLEWNNADTLGVMNASDKIINSFFQSVTLRTAGFAGVDQAALSDTSKLICTVMMFVGASPASTGGGVKTTTISLIIILALCVMRGRERICVFKREIAVDIVRRAIAIIIIGISVVFTGTCIISAIEASKGFDMIDIFYEVVSAFSTTGLSSVNTSSLSTVSQCLLMPLMYFGRVGPLTLAFALANRMENASVANRVRHPEESIMIG